MLQVGFWCCKKQILTIYRLDWEDDLKIKMTSKLKTTSKWRRLKKLRRPEKLRRPQKWRQPQNLGHPQKWKGHKYQPCDEGALAHCLQHRIAFNFINEVHGRRHDEDILTTFYNKKISNCLDRQGIYGEPPLLVFLTPSQIRFLTDEVD